MKPAIPLTNPRFRYVPAARTDIAKTFARVRREQKSEAQTNVRVLRKGGK